MEAPATITLSEKWQKALDECATNMGYTSFETFAIQGTKGRNYFGAVSHVRIEGIKHGEKDEDYVFMKNIGDDVQRNTTMESKKKYEREQFMYTVVLPKFEEMQQDHPRIYKYRIPKCHLISDEYVIMEDLAEDSYSEFDQDQLLDFEHTAVMLEDLARFHAFSFALKERSPEVFEKLSKNLKNMFFTEKITGFLQKSVMEVALPFVQNEDTKERLCKKIDNSDEVVVKLVQPKTEEELKYAVICHGDPHLRNVLFKYDDNDIPSETVMLDYQFSCLQSPVGDVYYMMTTSSKPEVMDQYDRLLDIYYDALTLSLNKFQCKVKDLYPKEVFQKDLVRFHPFAITSALVIMRVFSKPNVSDEENTKILLAGNIFAYDDEDCNARFKERLNGRLNNFINAGII